MQWQEKRIGWAFTGSFCTFHQVIPQIKALVALGAQVTPILSDSVRMTDTRFGRAIDWIDVIKAETGRLPLFTLGDVEPIGPKRLLDALVIAPCTGNTIAKLANGVSDNAVTLAAKSHLRNGLPLLIAVSTNDGLGRNARNIGALLNQKHIYFAPYGQDDPIGKPNSLVACFDHMLDALEAALQGRQVQPLLMMSMS